MHSGDSYLLSIGKAVNSAVLSAGEASGLAFALQQDSRDYFQSAVISFADALRSVEEGFFSWATVKLYYSVFYALRARLAIAGDCLFYVGKSPKILSSRPGSITSNLTGTTHKAVISRFQTAHKRDYFISQDIGGKSPLEWFTEQREKVNYRAARFCEPDVPDYFKFAATTDRRRMLEAYMTDDIYVFDEDHAIIAFPFKLLRDLRSSLAASRIAPLVPIEVEFLKKKMKDRSGLLKSLDSVIF